MNKVLTEKQLLSIEFNKSRRNKIGRFIIKAGHLISFVGCIVRGGHYSPLGNPIYCAICFRRIK